MPPRRSTARPTSEQTPNEIDARACERGAIELARKLLAVRNELERIAGLCARVEMLAQRVTERERRGGGV